MQSKVVMRYVVGFVFALALVASPLTANAQAGDEDATSEPNLEEPAAPSEPAGEEGGLSPGLRKRTRQKWDPGTYDVPPSRPATEEPALQLELDSAGGGFTLIPSGTAHRYTLEEMELRVKRARIGLGVSALSTVVGITLSVVAGANAICFFDPCSVAGWVYPVVALGGVLVVGGIVGMAVSARKLRRRKRDLREAHYGTPRRVQWDLARSRVVF